MDNKLPNPVSCLSEKELAAYHKFCKKHTGSKHWVQLCFSFSNIGIGVAVRCRKCKKYRDITDYDTW